MSTWGAIKCFVRVKECNHLFIYLSSIYEKTKKQKTKATALPWSRNEASAWRRQKQLPRRETLDLFLLLMLCKWLKYALLVCKCCPCKWYAQADKHKVQLRADGFHMFRPCSSRHYNTLAVRTCTPPPNAHVDLYHGPTKKKKKKCREKKKGAIIFQHLCLDDNNKYIFI